MRRTLTSAAVVVFAGLAFAGCGDDNGEPEDGAASDATVQESTTQITLVATDFKFDKTDVEASVGVPIKFQIRNEADGTKHNLTVEGLEVDKDVEAGQEAEQTVTAEAGTYNYFCEYHPQGMKGTLTVS